MSNLIGNVIYIPRSSNYMNVFCLSLYDYQNIIYWVTFCYKTTLPLKQLKMEVYSKEINNMKIMIIT